MDIIINSNSNAPIYEQITNQIKSMVMNGELKAGDSIPSMRSLAKSLHISVITVQRAYGDLQRDGFIEMTVGRGSYIAAQNIDFIKEENFRLIEGLLKKAVAIGKANDIKIEQLIKTILLFYEEERDE